MSNRSGRFNSSEGAVDKLSAPCASWFEKSIDSDRDKAWMLPCAELDLDREGRLDAEKKEAKGERDDRDSSAPRLESLLLLRGRFLVRRRGVLLDAGSRSDCACSSCIKRFSSSFLSASRRLVTRFSLLFPFLLSCTCMIPGRLSLSLQLSEEPKDCSDSE